MPGGPDARRVSTLPAGELGGRQSMLRLRKCTDASSDTPIEHEDRFGQASGLLGEFTA
jgi:hypothetical protein